MLSDCVTLYIRFIISRTC